MDNPLTPITPEQLQKQEAKTAKEGYIHRILVAFDIFCNVLFNGDEDETISSRSARAAEEGKVWGILMSKFLTLFQANHGVKAQAGDLERAQAVEKLEEGSGFEKK